ncbi:MAG: DNA polymerase I [Planctomycetales bacterium]|nr:DNA polymerase I [Planctomycetales bacterium]
MEEDLADASPKTSVSASDGATLPDSDWTIYAVDAHSLIFQVFHAMHGSDLSSPQGEPVGAVYGFTRDILQLLERKRPTVLVCAFDLPGPTFRHELYDDYKADRGEMPEELASQLPKIRAVLDALGIEVAAVPGYEADDVLAAMASQADQTGAQLMVVTGDKDCRQLISGQVKIYNIRKDEVYDATALYGDWGVAPEPVVDFQALVGDKIDNVPGVPLIGPKAAKELLDAYGSLEATLDRAEEVKQKKRRENLIAYRDDALLSKKLVELDRQTPISIDWQAARRRRIDMEKVATLFRDLGFRSLGERAAELAGEPIVVEASEAVAVDYQVIDTPEAFEALLDELRAQKTLSVDVETTDINPRRAIIVGYALAWRAGQGRYVPVRGPEGDRVLDPQQVADALRPILEDPLVAKVGQNLKYDLVAMRSAGIHMRGVAFDTMVASYLLDAGERSHNLDELARRYLNHETIKIDELIGKGKQQKRMDEVSVEAVGTYAAEDADIPLRLMPLLEKRLQSDQLRDLNERVETPLIEVLADLEYAGVAVDVERLGELGTEYRARLEALAEEIEQLAGRPINIASPKQLAELLFQDLKLPVLKKTKTGASTDASVLEELAPLHPLPAKIVEYRQYAKLLGTYIDALPELVLPETGRVHASLNQVVAATGRLSSSNPNLQNIPVRTREGREIRSAFRAGPPGWQLLAADYSQIELRVLAHYSGDPALREAFETDQDIHRIVASEVHQTSLEDVTPEMRRRAKAVNFGVIYGQSPFGLAKSLGIDQQEAADFIENYFARYVGVREFMVETLASCRELGYVTTLLGRRRAVQGVRAPTPDLREPKTGALRQLNLPERTAVNSVIQGSAADLIKLAMLRVHDRLQRENSPAQLLLQIHDELLLESPQESLSDLASLVREEMEAAYELTVPLRVDVKTGPNWAECEPWE